MANVTLFHTKKTDLSKEIYQGLYHNLIDISDLYGTHIMCALDNLAVIEKRLPQQTNSQLYFLGSGNYHYLTLPLLNRIREPFTLVVFDHHNDAGLLPFKGMTSCGSWIHDALEEIPFLEKVVLIGPSGEDEKEVKDHLSKKIERLNEEDMIEKNIQELAKQIPTEKIYLSIDRDILSEKDVQTNWDQGTVRLPQLMKDAELISANHIVIGADVCGDLEWDYRSTSKFRLKSTLKQSVETNRQLFELLNRLLQHNPLQPNVTFH